MMAGMRWGKIRPWFALVGPLLAVVVLTAAPAGVKAGELSWPKWLVAGLVAAGSVLVAVWTPLVKARTDAMAARTTRAAERDAQAEEALNRLPTVKGKILLVKDVTDRALLGIHEAIPLPADSASEQGLSPDLPAYVLRDIDADLRTALKARSKTGGFVLLVGPAAAGKTRCAYEAIQAVLPHWRLFMPPDASTLTDLVAGRSDLKHSVVWLNETQNFLTGPDHLAAATVRRILADTARPVILIGTIWPNTYDQLRASPPSAGGENEEEQELNKDAREVLKLARRFSLGSWSDQEWERAQELTSVDPRIGQVLRHRGRPGLAQMLSAAPELIHRWEQADSRFGQAVITAAVIARRCNHPAVVPSQLIEALAQELLSGNERATAGEAWLAEALTWACQPVHFGGGVAPLQAFGQTMGRVDGYVISDILVGYSGRSAPASHVQITPNIWEILVDRAASQACLPIGTEAYLAGMPAIATSAWERAAGAGSTDAMFNLAIVLYRQDDVEGSRTWCQQAADAGHTSAMVLFGHFLRDEGDAEGASTWWEQAADAGDTGGMVALGNLLRDQGDTEGARTWYTRATDNGDTSGMVALGNLLRDQGDVEGARTWYTRAADNGDTDAMFTLGSLLRDQGDAKGANTWWQQAADAGHTSAMVALGDRLHRLGDAKGARTWFTRAADNGDTNAMIVFGNALHRRADAEGARTWYTRAADNGDTSGMFALGSLLYQQGDVEGARTWYTRAADNGHLRAMFGLGNLLREQGDAEGAHTWYTRAADNGHPRAAAALSALTAED